MLKGADQMSRPARRYPKEINPVDEQADPDEEPLVTRSHHVIGRWAEERDALSATVPGTEHGDRPGVLRFQFPGSGGRQLRRVSWDDWFATFEEEGLSFISGEEAGWEQEQLLHPGEPDCGNPRRLWQGLSPGSSAR